MSTKDKDKGVILVLLERFNKQRLPRALSLKKKVDSGELLDDYDHKYMIGYIVVLRIDSSERSLMPIKI